MEKIIKWVARLAFPTFVVVFVIVTLIKVPESRFLLLLSASVVSFFLLLLAFIYAWDEL